MHKRDITTEKVFYIMLKMSLGRVLAQRLKHSAKWTTKVNKPKQRRTRVVCYGALWDKL